MSASPAERSHKPLFQKATIIGLGLIGGSIALGLKKAGLARTVLGVDQDAEQLKVAASRGAVDAYTSDPAGGVEGADLIVLATPVGAFEQVIRQVLPKLPAACLVTDVGSTKAVWVGFMERTLPETVVFVGGHPIAGKEKSGIQAASETLFKGAKCVLTSTPRTDPRALERIKGLWEALGSEVVLMSPAEHDRIFAAVSHLPHLVAYALISALLELNRPDEDLLFYSAGGLRDFTRIAGSSPEMWRDVCLSNRENLLEAVEACLTALRRIKDYIQAQDGEALYREFGRARKIRERMS